MGRRRDRPPDVPEVDALIHATESGDRIPCTGLVLQELLRGLSGAKARQQIIERIVAFRLLNPDREGHIVAPARHNVCRSRAVQASPIDALLAQLCIRDELTILTIDIDFKHIAKHTSLQIWNS
jgi:predicted nucleic acid-binding protein